jgi:hypothetical protein
MFTTEKLKPFAENLRLQIEDIDLTNQNVTLDHYYDTHAIWAIIQGYNELIEDEKQSAVKRFRDDRTLLYSLAAGSHLGVLKMLSPHLAELSNLLDLDLATVSREQVNSQRRHLEFLKQIKVEIPDLLRSDLFTSENPSHKDAVDLARRHAGSAINLYKAIQLIRGISWPNRLAHLRRQGILDITAEPTDYDEVLRSKEFDQLRASFDKGRPQLQINNFNDAVAVVLLIRQVASFRAGASKRLPRMLAAPSLIRPIRDAGLESQLMYDYGGSAPGTVFREVPYYTTKAALVSLPSVAELALQHGSSEVIDTRTLYAQINQILKTREKLANDILDSATVSGRPLRAIIREIHEFAFFENVWLNSGGHKEISAVWNEITEILEQLDSDRFQHSVGLAIAEAKQELEKNVSEYRIINTLWRRLEQAVDTVRARFASVEQSRENLLWMFGLARFGFSGAASHGIATALEALFNKGGVERGIVFRRVVTCYFQYRISNALVDNRELAIISGVLWGLRLDDLIVDLLMHHSRLGHFSLKALFAAAVFRSSGNQELGIAALNDIEGLLETESDSESRGRLLIALAYLYHHLWVNQNNKPRWLMVDTTDAPFADGESESQVMEKAIRYAGKASCELAVGSRMQIYAVNQYLFYLVQGADNSRFQEMKQAALKLSRHRHDVSVWQYRFDDTLGHYFHRRALAADTAEDRRRFTENAREYIEAAAAAAPGDAEVQEYATIFRIMDS